MGRAGAIARSLALGAAGVAVGCSLLTHAYDYQVGLASDASAPDAASDPPACGACAAHPDFARAPCAPDGGADDAGATPTRYYVVAAPLELGARVATWSDGAYAVGLDEDCADPVDGSAATCTPTAPALSPLPTLAHGIDNALATQLLGPLAALPGGSDVEAQVGAWIGAGLGGFVVVVDDWNGLASDPHVVVRIAPVVRGGATPSIASAPSSESAFVEGGRIAASFGTQQVTLPLGSTSGALLALPAFGALATGAIGEGSIDGLVVAGYLVSDGQLGEHFDDRLAQLVFGCGAGSAGARAVAAREPGAFDLHDPGSTSCTRMSFGMRAAHATRLAAAPAITLDDRAPCPADAGADAAGD